MGDSSVQCEPVRKFGANGGVGEIQTQRRSSPWLMLRGPRLAHQSPKLRLGIVSEIEHCRAWKMPNDRPNEHVQSLVVFAFPEAVSH